MTPHYKIRAYCPNRVCPYINRPSIAEAVDAASALVVAERLNSHSAANCPDCGTRFEFYPLAADGALEG